MYYPLEILQLLKKVAAEHSDDPKTFVGAAIVRLPCVEGSDMVIGTNKFPIRGVFDKNNKEEKNKYILHAEVVAALRIPDSWRGKPCICIVTHAPCSNCAKVLAAVGADHIYYGEVHKGSDLEACTRLGMALTHLVEDTDGNT